MDRRSKHLSSEERGMIFSEHSRGSSQRVIGAILDRPASTIRIFSSEECSLRVARRISFTTCSAGTFVVTGFFIIFNSNWGKDEPQTLRYAIMLNCSMGADGGQYLVQPTLCLCPTQTAGATETTNRFAAAPTVSA
jgi:hypothetical protein